MANEFTLPSLGENIKAGDVLRVLIKAGDAVTVDQPVLELETDKATVEVPSSLAGTVAEVRVKDGDRIDVGQVVFTVSGAAAAAPAQPASGSQVVSTGGRRRRRAGPGRQRPERPLRATAALRPRHRLRVVGASRCACRRSARASRAATSCTCSSRSATRSPPTRASSNSRPTRPPSKCRRRARVS